MADVVVVGGGIVGLSAAYHLRRAGVGVTLVDAALEGQATAAGAGIISPGSAGNMPPALFPLSAASVALYPRIVEVLRDAGEPNTGFERVGALHVATSDDEAARLLQIRDLALQRRAEGVGLIGDVSEISSVDARKLFPPLGSVAAALHLAGSARVDGRLLRDALHRAFEKLGGSVIRGEARPEIHAHAVRGVSVEGNQVPADIVILASGAWTGGLAAELGLCMPVAPQRGQILHLDIPGVQTAAWPIVLGFHSHYILTFPPNRVVAGATREDGTGFDPRVTVAGAAEVIGEALRIAPDLATGTIREIRVGLRPASPDGLPVLGRSPRIDNLFVATGHGPSGLQLGPYSGVAVADIAVGRPVSVDLSPFDPARFTGTRL